jgi:hypothetical protein
MKLREAVKRLLKRAWQNDHVSFGVCLIVFVGILLGIIRVGVLIASHMPPSHVVSERRGEIRRDIDSKYNFYNCSPSQAVDRPATIYNEYQGRWSYTYIDVESDGSVDALMIVDSTYPGSNKEFTYSICSQSDIDQHFMQKLEQQFTYQENEVRVLPHSLLADELQRRFEKVKADFEARH